MNDQTRRLSNWQPIATAPKDGTPIMLFARSTRATASVICVGWWIESMGWLEAAFVPNHTVGIVPSHWMPLPEFPEIDYAVLEREHFGDPDKKTGVYAKREAQ